MTVQRPEQDFLAPTLLSRRQLLVRSAGSLAIGIGAPALFARSATAQTETMGPIRTEAWAEVSALAEGVWAVVSTPENRDMTTVCNGGIVAGRERLLVIEAFAGRRGAKWVSDTAFELTGRRPTDVVLTHYHGDHTGGLTGFIREGETPRFHATASTLARVRSRRGEGETQEALEARNLIDGAAVLSEEAVTELDLGGRQVELHPRRGHTASDVTVELSEESLAFGGDLLWNQMIPNFVDARPIELARTLRDLQRRDHRYYVPGHGPLADGGILEANIVLTDALEEAGRRSFEAGVEPAQAASGLVLPDGMGEWRMFSDNYIERALAAWHRDLAP